MEHLLKKSINNVRERKCDGKPWNDERITDARDWEVLNHLALNTALWEVCRKMEAVCVMVINTKCLPGICLFNPLSKAI